MISLSKDLSVNLTQTGICSLKWADGGAHASFLQARDDAELLGMIRHGGTVVGIDVPLGWPIGFAQAVGHYMASDDGRWPKASWPESYFRLRSTDEWVAKHARKRQPPVSIRPLSVSADKLGAPAMKAAWLLSEIARGEPGTVVDRSGREGRFVEVYPTAAIRLWDLKLPPYRSKNKEETYEALTTCREELTRRSGGVLQGLDGMQTEHQVDALICALVARAARLPELTVAPPSEKQEAARLEGWIHVPAAPITAPFPTSE